MSRTSLQRRRRIFLHFLLGIGMPSLLLAYPAFRGIQNDIALLERERLNAHQAVARVQKKSDLLQEAVASYQSLGRDYGTVRVGALPAAVTARMELGILAQAMGDPDGAADTLLALYEELVRGAWTLARSQHEFVAQQLHDGISEALSEGSGIEEQRTQLARLQDEQRRREESTARLLTFQNHAATALLARGARSTESVGNGLKRFMLDVGAQTYLVSLTTATSRDTDHTAEIRGLLFDARHLRDTLLRSAIEQHAAGQDIHWLVRGRDSEVLLGSDAPAADSLTVRAGLAGSFPPWSIEFYQRSPHLLEALLTSRRGVYVYMFILLAGILVFGLTLTVRIVTQELELARMKSDFVSTVSHEFKSPLTSIRQLAEMLQAGRVPTEERRQRYYDVLVEQSERLSLLIDNILDFARMEEGRKEFRFETLDVAPLLEELVATVQQRVRHEGFTVRMELDAPLPAVRADRAALTQAVTNLLDNALKYSGQAREVCVRGHATGQSLVIAVEDSGIGIQAEEIEHVFDRFYRGGDELTRSVKGSGLGLTLVKQIVEAHGGTVHVESRPGRGSTFSIRLPIQPAEVQ